MAQEIKVTASIAVTNDNFEIPKIGGSQLLFDQAAQGGGVPGSMSIPVLGSAIDLSELGTEGWAWFRNLDDDNYIEHGPESGGNFYPYGRMEPGEPAVFRLSPGKTVHMKANIGPCLVQILVMED